MAGRSSEEEEYQSLSKKRNTNPGRTIKGGRIYGSILGESCHWCRQKTEEDHVKCSRRGCNLKFCGRCLANRHGEDVKKQMQPDVKWVCPKCRGGCGEGCKNCCNCSACRRGQGMRPTHFIIDEARKAGYYNVHDYLIYQKTGESPEEIASRKNNQGWITGVGVATMVKFKFQPKKLEDDVAVPTKVRNRTRMRGSVGDLTEESPRYMSQQMETMSFKKQKNMPVVAEDPVVKSEWSDDEIPENVNGVKEEPHVHTNMKSSKQEFVPPKPAAFVKDEPELHVNVGTEPEHCEEDVGFVTPKPAAPLSFKDGLKEKLHEPFDSAEFDELMRVASNCSEESISKQTRRGTYFLKTTKKGRSYFDHHPDLREKVESAETPADKLRLLRAFFFWLQHVGDASSFRPWASRNENGNCDDCCELDGPDCELTQVVVSLENTKKKTIEVKTEIEIEQVPKLTFPIKVKAEPV